ncbi:hypothetical protein AX17_004997 [Amanita inopinata Kibby_2008]|nr:hypothetical protein AX17_004997 [Amanita inopinata Kibby_2008]
MNLMNRLLSLIYAATVLRCVSSTTVADIQGVAFQSPLVGQPVSGVTGLVTAKASNGFFIKGQDVTDVRTSTGLFVFTTSTAILHQVSIGDEVSVDAKVAEFRSSSSPNNLFLTQLTSPTSVAVLSTGNVVTPVVLGVDRTPPTQQMSALDVGPDGFLSVPNNSSLVEAVNATLQPDLYGLDFWESLEGQLVSVPGPTVADFENSFGEFWVYGNWVVTGKNSRGGLTITFGADGIPDANPETVIIGKPLDGTTNPSVSIGAQLSDITGVVYYQFGFYYILPLTAPTILSFPTGQVSPTTLTSSPTDGCDLTIADYNINNFAPTSPTLSSVASHIGSYLRSPDLVFLQEIQDNSGPTDDGVTSANVTLTNLVNAIAANSGVNYNFIDIQPINDADGGQPGGNIRVAYLYRPEKLTLVPGSPVGGSLDAVQVTSGPHLSFNPGRIDPSNTVWTSSRKPLAAEWQTSTGKLFTINVHFTSKGGSSSTQGDARPPVNSPVTTRTSQASTVAQFVQSILAQDAGANVVVAGDYNEYAQTRSVFQSFTNVLYDIDEAANIDPVERYSYVFDQNTEELDHVYISSGVKGRALGFEHVHVNSWSSSRSTRASDHDPSIAKIRLC